MLIPGYGAAPLVDGTSLLSRRLFWPIHLYPTTRDHDRLHAGFGVDAADAERFFEELSDPERWPTFRIPLAPFTVAVIERQLEMVEAERRRLGADYQDHGLLFPREDGSPQDPDWVMKKFERLAEQCPGVLRIVFHGMRHTHATLLLEDGVSLKVVAERLGDREDTVVKLYGHVTPRGRAVAVASVGTWWDDPTPGVRPAADCELAELQATVAQLEE